MASVLHPLGRDDERLARRVSAGDVAAFAVLDERHRAGLLRYAGSLLRRSEHDAEDVVQDVLICVHDALRAGNVPDQLRPWLYRLTRNRAIDEVRRKRWGNETLDAEHAFVPEDARRQPGKRAVAQGEHASPGGGSRRAAGAPARGAAGSRAGRLGS